jgi:hypothetical protein
MGITRTSVAALVGASMTAAVLLVGPAAAQADSAAPSAPGVSNSAPVRDGGNATPAGSPARGGGTAVPTGTIRGCSPCILPIAPVGP